MPEKKKKAVVPRLRFPEFRDAGEWEVKRLGEVADVVAAGDLDQEDFSSERTGDYIFPIFSNSVTERGLYGFCSNPKYKKNSVTVTARGTLGVAFYRDVDFSAIGRLLVLKNLKGILPYFLQEIWNHSVMLALEDGGIPQLTAIKAKPTKLAVPPLPEQRKIADCLGSLDDLIRAEEAALEALKKHKKGLMQRLFPRKGETTPRLRFPEFRDAGEWEVKRLGEVISLEYGAALPEDQRIKGPFPVVGSNGIVGYHNEHLVDGPAIVIGRKGSAGQVNWIEDACYPIDTTYYVVLKNTEDHLRFFRLLLEHHRLSDIVSPGGVPGLNRDDVYSVISAIPVPAEQQKIADFLSSLDDLIRAKGDKIEALKQHKKGLMQRLFPQEEA